MSQNPLKPITFLALYQILGFHSVKILREHIFKPNLTLTKTISS